MEHMLTEGRLSVPPHRIAGHARVYVAFDTLVRVLRQAGHDVRYVRNFTGILIIGPRDYVCQSGCLMSVRCILSWLHELPFRLPLAPDIDDKIIRRANESGIPWTELTARFIQAFHEDMVGGQGQSRRAIVQSPGADLGPAPLASA